MKAILFDVDDTLYDQLIPFQQAFEKNFAFKNIPVEELYILSRELSDEVFHLSESGKMSIQDMHIYRIKTAMECFDKKLSDEEAISFQNDYQRFQREIQLTSDVKESLKLCLEKGITIGVITNGPKEHQRKKIKKLELEKWIPKENILISSEVGFAKPDIKIFQLAESVMNLNSKTTYYVGDSFNNDMIGAKNAGWKVVWSNRRNHQMPDNSIDIDYLLNNKRTLLEFVRKIT